MITKEEIERINTLARKQKCDGLSVDEKCEQDTLRRKYIDSMKANLKSQLDMIKPLNQDEDNPSCSPDDNAPDTKH